ncbi:hypothetical protein LWI29_028726 [Acer saccharum]|uniref:Fe2OG dioxygenase domain-containing protein n=1 Tax=Acer saccharum TaxID=4024 RepID=A0AA39T3S7_ACESA|nr:hypothetical protein LWI29_028726 [Acer saccharum]
MSEIDPAFIQAPEYRPKLKVIKTDELPVIDLSNDTKEVVLEIREACKTWGFFHVINHGVPLELLSRIKKTSKEFFDLPLEEKKLAKRDEVNPLGYHDSEHTKNVRDWKEVFDFLAKDPSFVPASHEPDDTQLRTIRNQWPAHPPEFRDVCEEYAGEVEKLAYKMLELISLSLGLPSDRLHSCFKDQISYLKVNHYPACPFPELALGVSQHKDPSALTILAQDEVGGLEVRRKSDRAWISVKPVPDAFIINLGDATQVWSNDRYESQEHRVVVNSEKERYREFNWGKFSVSRSRSDFKKRETIYDIRGYQQILKGLSIVYNSRASNDAVDALAKLSSSDVVDSIVWEAL